MSQQVDFVIEWLNMRKPHSVSYIGWRHDTNCDPLKWCKDNKLQVTVIEAYAPNVAKAVVCGYNAVHGRIDVLVSSRMFAACDCVLWLHGPEHVARDVMWYTLGGIVARCPHVLIQAPIGYNEQGVYGGNPYEVHKQSLVSYDFECMGWQADEHCTEHENTFSAWLDS